MNRLQIIRIDTGGAWQSGRRINTATRDALAYVAVWPNATTWPDPGPARHREVRHNGDHIVVTVRESPQ